MVGPHDSAGRTGQRSRSEVLGRVVQRDIRVRRPVRRRHDGVTLAPGRNASQNLFEGRGLFLPDDYDSLLDGKLGPDKVAQRREPE